MAISSLLWVAESHGQGANVQAKSGKDPRGRRTTPFENPAEEQRDSEARSREFSRRADLVLK